MSAAAVSTSPRAQRTRTALLAAGFDLLAERPIDAIAIDDIVAQAGVAKGSFFNHFADKPGFAQAIAVEVRSELERRIDAVNAAETDPVMRLAGGMREAVEFALSQRSRAIVMLRGLELSTGLDHELNRGLRADIERLIATGEARTEAARSGVRYWLGLCQIAQLNVIERQPERGDAAQRLGEMIILGLCGLGIAEWRARNVAATMADRLSRGEPDRG